VSNDETLKAAAALHTAWSLKYGDTVSYVAEDADPVDGQETDLSVWQADRSAPAEIADELNAKLYALAFPDEPVAAAAGHDVTPGHDELHHYWTVGEGRREWVDSPKPWTTLVALLTKHVGPEKAKVYASRWFFEVKGYYAGSDLNRVAHGHPPRGHNVGPG
jgi:hypothetical protein